MTIPPTQLSMATDGFSPSADLVAHAEEKASKLRRHAHPRVAVVRVHVKLELAGSGERFFTACVRAEIPGPDQVVHATAETPLCAISRAFGKIERAITGAGRACKHRQRHEAVARATAG